VEPIFPPELRRRVPTELALPGPRCAWYRPLTLDSLLQLKAEHPHAKLVVGNTGELWAVLFACVCLADVMRGKVLTAFFINVYSITAVTANRQGMFSTLCFAEVGIEMKFKGQRYPVLIGATHVPELNAIEVGPFRSHPAAALVPVGCSRSTLCYRQPMFVSFKPA